MKLVSTFFIFLLLLSCSSYVSTDPARDNEKLLKKASDQLKMMVAINNQSSLNGQMVFPRSLNSDGTIKYVSKNDWTSGFYPGILWLMYELTEDNFWEKEAILYTEKLAVEPYKPDPRVEFKIISSFGNGFRLTQSEEYKEILIESARVLISRFNENTGSVRSFCQNSNKFEFPVAIENLVDLELLFFAWKETGEPVFKNIATKHAETTIQNHFSESFSAYQILNYDTISGQVQQKVNLNGYSVKSCWSRGQALALYGFVMLYDETKSPKFLQQAEKLVEYILGSAKTYKDLIPYWDYNAPKIPDEPRDASAAAITASALYKLSTFSEKNNQLTATADSIMSLLASEQYFSKKGSGMGFLLKHSTGCKPNNKEIDTSVIYADYYFLEALKRKIEIENTNVLVNN
jgi:hypothetical protein